ncbi:hypothetical protein [Roseovarius aquimarinus]|uniref:ABC-type glycine betaine transport system substrate-binding domain-containing protein n=1 Tax=Roseovarius aquimarinus TaxID=1229156 RepID=A0ABW7I299_9RHOB
MRAFVIIISLALVGAVIWGFGRPVLNIERPEGSLQVSAGAEAGANEIEARLLAAGLHPVGILNDLGVDNHMDRLARGTVDVSTLSAYADAIDALTARGQSLPPTLWDVSTPALREAGWTVYTLTEALSSEAGGVHVDLLIDAYAAFLSARPDALEGSLALLPLARAYVEALPEEARAEREAHARTPGEATLLIWQALLSGTTRHNPITHRPLWSHGYVGHFSVPHIHQYATGEGLTPSQVWGTEGFAAHVVGPASNANQVEHMGISALLQGVVHVPGAVLSAVEAVEVMVDGEDPDAAAADRALNQAIREALLPRVEAPAEEIVVALREALGDG